MFARRAAKAAAGIFSVMLAGAASLALPGVAAAETGPGTSGNTITNAIQAIEPYSPGTFDSGQSVDIAVPANTVFTPGASIFVLECAAPNGVDPTSTAACDGNTGYEGGTLSAQSDGSVDAVKDTVGSGASYPGSGDPYQIYALPDQYLFGESTNATPKCGLGAANECVLYIGEGGGGDTGFSQPHFFSQPFQVHADPTDSGTLDPGDGTAPTVTKVSPAYGAPAGDTKVTVTGTGFAQGDTVKFGTATATDVVVAKSGTSLTAYSPAGTGTVDVTVSSTYEGTTETSAADRFSYGPVVTKVSPADGSSGGGNKVTVVGHNLAAGDTVDFGSDNPGTVDTVNSAGTAMTVVSPPEVGQGVVTVDVTVTDPINGTSPTTAGDGFTYAAPMITKVAPDTGPGGGGTKVTITGKYLGGATLVTFGTQEILPYDATNNPTGFTVNAPGTAIKAVTPADGDGPVDVSVTTAAGSITDSAAFDYVAPVITKISPDSGPGAGGGKVTITGKDMTGASVTFGGVTATVLKNTVGSVQVTVPAGSGTEAVVVSTSAGSADTVTTTTGSEPATYGYLAPTITKITPSAGPAGGGGTATITGSELSGATVTVGGTPVTPSLDTLTTIKFTLPAGSGAESVVVTTPAGSASATYTYGS